MNNPMNTDTNKTTSQPAPFVKKGESNNDAQPAKVEDPKPSTPDTDRQATGEAKQAATDDTAGKSSR